MKTSLLFLYFPLIASYIVSTKVISHSNTPRRKEDSYFQKVLEQLEKEREELEYVGLFILTWVNTKISKVSRLTWLYTTLHGFIPLYITLYLAGYTYARPHDRYNK